MAITVLARRVPWKNLGYLGGEIGDHHVSYLEQFIASFEVITYNQFNTV
jgi:hypothetical protein